MIEEMCVQESECCGIVNCIQGGEGAFLFEKAKGSKPVF